MSSRIPHSIQQDYKQVTPVETNGFVHSPDRSMDPVPENEDDNHVDVDDAVDQNTEATYQTDRVVPIVNCPGPVQSIVNRHSVHEIETPNRLKLPEHQPVSSTPHAVRDQCLSIQLNVPPLRRAPRSDDPAQRSANGVSGRVIRFVLAITPKTLFLDVNPTLRPINVSMPEELEVASAVPLVPELPQPASVRLRCHNSDTKTPAPCLTTAAQHPVPVTSPKSRPIFSPKGKRKLRDIKAKVHSRSLSNIRQLDKIDSDVLDPLNRTLLGSDRGLGSGLTASVHTLPT
ncbi:unnamed protein product, partial [Echinostoma caproni]|uniref:Uncharacterized protein n=1 Tax=Echinostoma caproni TaxID=27848 RepID=A0A183B9T6_9TREM